MAKQKRRLDNEINAGSMADIAFLLLIFFLVTTTIEMDKGIMVKLPPWEPDRTLDNIPPKNILSVKINAQNELLIEKERASVEYLRKRTKAFIMNPDKRKDLPSNPRKAIVSLQNDRGTAYETYVFVYNELKAAYNELWDEKALQDYKQAYNELNKENQQLIRNQIPLVISEAEPTDLVHAIQ